MSTGTEVWKAPEGFERLAQIVLNDLPVTEQNEVLRVVEQLSSRPIADWPAGEVRQLSGDETLYLVNVNSDLCLIARIEEGKPLVVVDMVRPETLKMFRPTQDARK